MFHSTNVNNDGTINQATINQTSLVDPSIKGTCSFDGSLVNPSIEGTRECPRTLRVKVGCKASNLVAPRGCASGPTSLNGTHRELPYELMLWSHEIHSNNWYIDGYDKRLDIFNCSDIWKFLNNFEALLTKEGHKHYYLMKSGIDPTWEHPSNSKGGQCSFRVDCSSAIKLWVDLCARFVCNKLCLCDNIDDINGLSYSPKNNWVIIKIWNKNGKNNIATKLQKDFKKKLDNDNVSVKYKINIPEH